MVVVDVVFDVDKIVETAVPVDTAPVFCVKILTETVAFCITEIFNKLSTAV